MNFNELGIHRKDPRFKNGKSCNNFTSKYDNGLFQLLLLRPAKSFYLQPIPLLLYQENIQQQ